MRKQIDLNETFVFKTFHFTKRSFKVVGQVIIQTLPKESKSTSHLELKNRVTLDVDTRFDQVSSDILYSLVFKDSVLTVHPKLVTLSKVQGSQPKYLDSFDLQVKPDRILLDASCYLYLFFFADMRVLVVDLESMVVFESLNCLSSYFPLLKDAKEASIFDLTVGSRLIAAVDNLASRNQASKSSLDRVNVSVFRSGDFISVAARQQIMVHAFIEQYHPSWKSKLSAFTLTEAVIGITGKYFMLAFKFDCHTKGNHFRREPRIVVSAWILSSNKQANQIQASVDVGLVESDLDNPLTKIEKLKNECVFFEHKSRPCVLIFDHNHFAGRLCLFSLLKNTFNRVIGWTLLNQIPFPGLHKSAFLKSRWSVAVENDTKTASIMLGVQIGRHVYLARLKLDH